MSKVYVGLFTGLILGIVAITQGFLALLAVAFLGGMGLAVGLALDGRIDLAALNPTDRSRR